MDMVYNDTIIYGIYTLCTEEYTANSAQSTRGLPCWFEFEPSERGKN